MRLRVSMISVFELVSQSPPSVPQELAATSWSRAIDCLGYADKSRLSTLSPPVVTRTALLWTEPVPIAQAPLRDMRALLLNSGAQAPEIRLCSSSYVCSTCCN